MWSGRKNDSRSPLQEATRYIQDPGLQCCPRQPKPSPGFSPPLSGGVMEQSGFKTLQPGGVHRTRLCLQLIPLGTFK